MTAAPANEYDEFWRSCSGSKRVARAVSIFNSVQQLLATKLRFAQPTISDAALKLALARQLYASDPGAQKLLDLAERSLNEGRV